MKQLFSLLQHPLTKGLDLDDPRTTVLRQRIIREKGFLSKVYREWCVRIRDIVPAGPGRVLELGSGGGILREFIPELLTSDVLALPQLDVVATGEALPFGAASLKAIVMTNVFHHVPDARAMLREAARVTRAGGRVVMIEPWNTPWSRLVYRGVHHEPFEPAVRDWALTPGGGPLSAANGALPWIVFERDRRRFEEAFPEWKVASITPFMPLSYVLSGGVSLRVQFPPVTYAFIRGVEELLPQRLFAMFAIIVLERASTTGVPVSANGRPAHERFRPSHRSDVRGEDG
ncbi:MAG: class I SAM-dependent methyltransferase [Gemmatimonadales bacterium]